MTGIDQQGTVHTEPVEGKLTTSLDREMNGGGKSLRVQEYLSIRHALPKTKVHGAILRDNASQERRLEMSTRHLLHTKKKNRFVHEQNIRTFLARQKRKQNKWKREDDVRLAGMNLPFLSFKSEEERPDSMSVVYRNPRYSPTKDKDKISVPLSQRMELKRDRTEVVIHREQTIMTKLPTVVELGERTIKRYEKYRGRDNLELWKSKNDLRFENLKNSLEETHINPDVNSSLARALATRGRKRDPKLKADDLHKEYIAKRHHTEPHFAKVMLPSIDLSSSKGKRSNSGSRVSAKSKIDFRSETRQTRKSAYEDRQDNS